MRIIIIIIITITIIDRVSREGPSVCPPVCFHSIFYTD